MGESNYSRLHLLNYCTKLQWIGTLLENFLFMLLYTSLTALATSSLKKVFTKCIMYQAFKMLNIVLYL